MEFANLYLGVPMKKFIIIFTVIIAAAFILASMALAYKTAFFGE